MVRHNITIIVQLKDFPSLATFPEWELVHRNAAEAAPGSTTSPS